MSTALLFIIIIYYVIYLTIGSFQNKTYLILSLLSLLFLSPTYRLSSLFYVIPSTSLIFFRRIYLKIIYLVKIV